MKRKKKWKTKLGLCKFTDTHLKSHATGDLFML